MSAARLVIFGAAPPTRKAHDVAAIIFQQCLACAGDEGPQDSGLDPDVGVIAAQQQEEHISFAVDLRRLPSKQARLFGTHKHSPNKGSLLAEIRYRAALIEAKQYPVFDSDFSGRAA